jgi:3-hydroxyisobutyrate dehydrogenase-like beta-hydroxyacid dehydrogenase
MAIVKVGFVGVGRMGRVMVQNLFNAGHQVRAWDVTPEAVAEVAKHGAEKATNAKEAFSGDAVISMLPNDDAMRGMFLWSDFLQAAGNRDTLRRFIRAYLDALAWLFDPANRRRAVEILAEGRPT